MRIAMLAAVVVASLVQSASVRAQQGLGGAGQALPAALLQCADVSSAVMTVANQDTRLRDWANLGRYRDANRTATPDVLFIGDSITDFWQQERFGGFFPGRNYADRGISAQSTPQMVVRFRPDVIALKPKAIGRSNVSFCSNPRAVTYVVRAATDAFVRELMVSASLATALATS